MVVGLMILVTLFLWIRSKNNNLAYASVLAHFLLLSVALYFLFRAITFNVDHPMASEEISLRVGVSGSIWAVSMICLLIGLIKFSKVNRVY
ncbi:hypothetical protein DP120_03150 [Planococcus halotolerans]|uniref:Uncharacterized protein n=1 Tax=Planococcus halotolerans TaxID=2233542 RepID=A0A365L8Q7_9BACL|nr:hypothetical protein DP120_03150 [Planococcus halotolerans]